jgi:alpha-beta hydrolase superfamily lysophospholipase
MPRLTPELMRAFLKKEGWKTRKDIYRKFHDQAEWLAKGNVIILHGYRGHVRAPHFKELANAFDDEYFNVATCDLPNFGKSKPKDPKDAGQIPSFARLVKVAKAMTYAVLTSRTKHNKPIIIIGYSVGALTIMRFLQTYPYIQKYLAGAVFISIPLHVAQNADPKILKYRRVIEPLFGMFARVRPHWSVAKYEPDEFSADDPGHFKGDMEAITANQVLKAAKAACGRLERIRLPVLFIHGEDDHIAPLDAMELAYGAISTPATDKKKIIYRSVDHYVLQREKHSIADIVAWAKEITDAIPPTPLSEDELDSSLVARRGRQLFFIFFCILTMLADWFLEVILETWTKIRSWYKRLFGTP